MNHEELSKILKVLSDPNRLKIVEILSKGCLCACDLLEYFDFSQPALSHHMKVLSQSNFVIVEKKGVWNNYSLNLELIEEFERALSLIFKGSVAKLSNKCILV